MRVNDRIQDQAVVVVVHSGAMMPTTACFFSKRLSSHEGKMPCSFMHVRNVRHLNFATSLLKANLDIRCLLDRAQWEKLHFEKSAWFFCDFQSLETTCFGFRIQIMKNFNASKIVFFYPTTYCVSG